MDRARLRLVVVTAGSGLLAIASLLLLDWFQIEVGPARGAIGLRTVSACMPGQGCETASLDAIRGSYATLAPIVFWVSLAFLAAVAVQVGTRTWRGAGALPIGEKGPGAGVLLAVAALATGYVFGPDTGEVSTVDIGIHVSVKRTWAPLLLAAAHGLGAYALALAARLDEELAPARALPGPYARTAAAPAAPASPPATAAAPRRAGGTAPPPVARRGGGTLAPPVVEAPASVRGVLGFALARAELTRAGLDARREDGAVVFVMWDDVVGVIARQLPADLEGALFVDVVSTPGSTVRILPWTALTGEVIEGAGEARARAVIAAIQARAPQARLDTGTQAFVAGEAPARQLADRAQLAEHDGRLI